MARPTPTTQPSVNVSPTKHVLVIPDPPELPAKASVKQEPKLAEPTANGELAKAMSCLPQKPATGKTTTATEPSTKKLPPLLCVGQGNVV